MKIYLISVAELYGDNPEELEIFKELFHNFEITSTTRIRQEMVGVRAKNKAEAIEKAKEVVPKRFGKTVLSIQILDSVRETKLRAMGIFS